MGFRVPGLEVNRYGKVIDSFLEFTVISKKQTAIVIGGSHFWFQFERFIKGFHCFLQAHGIHACSTFCIPCHSVIGVSFYGQAEFMICIIILFHGIMVTAFQAMKIFQVWVIAFDSMNILPGFIVLLQIEICFSAVIPEVSIFRVFIHSIIKIGQCFLVVTLLCCSDTFFYA